MADWTPQVGDLCMVEQPYSNATDVSGEIVIITKRRTPGNTGYLNATILRSGRVLGDWAAFRFCQLPNPQPKKDT